MQKYTVQIETSVSVEAETPEMALAQAREWAQESLSDSNAVGKVYAEADDKLETPVLTEELTF